MERKVANIYEDTRELLNQVKDVFEFKSDDQAVKFMCHQILSDPRFETIKQYLEAKRKAGEENAMV